MSLSSPKSSVHERHLEPGEKLFSFIVGPGRRPKDDVHAPYGFRLVVIDFDEDDVLLQTHRVIAASIEALSRDAAEIADARQRRRDQAIEKLVHLVLAQRHLDADRPARSDLECRNRLLRAREHRLLACDGGEVLLRALDFLLFGGALPRADLE